MIIKIFKIFWKCNLKVSKIISKFIEGVTLINDNINLEKFIKIEIDENFSQINFFDNSSLKFFQDFNFGISLLINDVCKVTALDKSLVINILKNSDFSKKDFENDFIEREYFSENNFRKIRKKLIFDIIEARIQELFEIFIKKNLNIESFTKEKFPIFFLIKDNLNIDLFKDIFLKQFLKGNEQNISFIEEPSIEQFYENVNNIVQFGWKKKLFQ